MRNKVTLDSLKALMRALAQQAQGPGAIYLTGGATALLLGFRELKPLLIRYPALDPADFENRVDSFLSGVNE